MKHFISIFFFTLLTCVASGQSKKDVETRNVFKFLLKDLSQPAWLQSKLDTGLIKMIKHYTFLPEYFADYRRINKDSFAIIDSVTLSDFEKDYINNCIKNLTNQRFTKADKIKYGLDSFKLLGTDKDIRKKLQTSFTYSILKPIFIRDNTVCIVYYDYGECGGLCGYSELSVLKKVAGQWKYLMDLMTMFN